MEDKEKILFIGCGKISRFFQDFKKKYGERCEFFKKKNF